MHEIDRLPEDALASEVDIARLAAIVQASDDAIIGETFDGTVESWNHGAEALYGYLRHEMIGHSIDVLLPPERSGEEAAVLTRIANGEHVPQFETVRLRRDGTPLNVSVTISPILDRHSQVIGASHVARNLAAPLNYELDVAHLAAIVNSSADAIVSKSLDGVIQSWNQGAEQLYGYTAAEVVGQSMMSLLPKGLVDQEKDILLRVRRGERVEPFETIRIHKCGKPVPVSLTISPIRNARGLIIGASHIAKDMTEAKQLKDKLQLSQKMEAVGRLAGGVAHDFNNLLTIIAGYSALLKSGLDHDPESSEMAKEIISAAERASDLTRQLLAFSRHQVAQLRPVNLNHTLLKTQAMLRRLIGEDIEVSLLLQPRLENVRSDPGQIGQILMNLAANARDAMPSGGKISIQTESWVVEADRFHQELGFAPGRYARLLFSDTGQGMDAETRAHIFEPFFTTKDIGKGTGLGLATVYGIVKRGGGQISVYSEPGCGTTFAIYLPCAEMEEAEIEPPVAKPAQGSETILLVEDEPGLRKLAHSILKANGYTVLAAGSVTEALAQAQDHAGPIQLMLTDIVMPGGNGEQLAIEMCRLRRDLRVVFMSGYSEHAILQRVLSEPGASFLQKPFTPVQLLKTIRDVLDS
jgi:PAS domain S-box-containing protein